MDRDQIRSKRIRNLFFVQKAALQFINAAVSVSGLLDVISSKLDSLAIEERRFSRDIQEELLRLTQVISAFGIVIVEAEEQSRENHQIKDWLAALRQVLEDAKELVDGLSPTSPPEGSDSRFACCIFPISVDVVVPSNTAEMIKEIRERLYWIAERRKFNIAERPLEIIAVVRSREPTRGEDPRLIIGRGKDKWAVISSLLSHDKKLSTIALVGMGGIGKTTLARMVFADEVIDANFELKLWVGVPQVFEEKLLVEKILEAATGEKYRNVNMDLLKELLHKNIDGKKFLLVLDDVWDLDRKSWSRLRGLLAGGASRSRMIITTRLQGDIASFSDVQFHVTALTKKESWSLLEHLAFRPSQTRSAAHQSTGREIVGRCSGYPLAIRVIGCLLYSKSSLSEWESLQADEEWTKQESGIRAALMLCYNDLPSNLKRCFAYCALFPRDYAMNVQKLISLWISHGYVEGSSSSYQSLEDVGLEYFRNLLWRSFFEEIELDEWGNIITCKMHDIVHDFARSLAEEDIVVSYAGENLFKTASHVSFYIDPHSQWNFPRSLHEAAARVQTFLLLNEPQNILGDFEPGCIIVEKQCDILFSNMKKLRVLDLHSSAICSVPRSLGKLEHLQYLDLSENEWIEKLPESTAELQRLQVLRLDDCKRLKQLPRGTKKLANLSQIGIDNCADLTHMPRGIGLLTLLSKLSRFVVTKKSLVSEPSGSLSELYGLNNLRGTLEIHNLQHGRHALSQIRAANLIAKQHLQTLLLAWDEREDDSGDEEDANDEAEDELALKELEPHKNLRGLEVRGFMGLEFPSWLSSLVDLVQINLVCCKSFKHLPPLNKLQFLERLTIDSLPALLYVDINKEPKFGEPELSLNFFPSLKRLAILNCPNLGGWWKQTASTLSEECRARFGSLFDLSIKSCPKLSSMPLFPPLKYLTISGASEALLQQIQRAMVVSPEESTAASSSTSDIGPKLRSLEIGGIDNLEFLPEDLFRNLSLKVLRVSNCRELKTLSHALRHLVSLESLSIWRCRKLELSDSESGQWEGLRSLRSLQISNLPKLVALPEWLKNAPRLQQLEISGCGNLASLPDWMMELVTLQYLIINSCPLLCEKCGSRKGSEWEKIAQIPCIKIAHKIIQRDGTYQL